MDKDKLTSNRAGTATVVLLAFLLFYFPSVVNILFEHNPPPGMSRINVVMSTIYTAIFCLNYFLIIPKTLFGRGRKGWFVISNVGLILIALCVIPIWSEMQGMIRGPHHPEESRTAGRMITDYLRFAIRDGVMMILAVALAYALQLSRERERIKHRELELDAERRKIELKGLKMQLNPHFLFNSLNNIYALIAISPDRAQEALHDLSSMLRYMIYDASSAETPLAKEISLIEDFVRLMRLRLNGSTHVECTSRVNEIDGLVIAPLLLLTLVENAFKHYAPSAGKGYISISITEDEEWIWCRVENTCALSDINDARKEVGKDSGIGLSNVRRQLRLLYPSAHNLEIRQEGNIFIADMRLMRKALRPS